MAVINDFDALQAEYNKPEEMGFIFSSLAALAAKGIGKGISAIKKVKAAKSAAASLLQQKKAEQARAAITKNPTGAGFSMTGKMPLIIGGVAVLGVIMLMKGRK